MLCPGKQQSAYATLCRQRSRARAWLSRDRELKRLQDPRNRGQTLARTNTHTYTQMQADAHAVPGGHAGHAQRCACGCCLVDACGRRWSSRSSSHPRPPRPAAASVWCPSSVRVQAYRLTVNKMEGEDGNRLGWRRKANATGFNGAGKKGGGTTARTPVHDTRTITHPHKQMLGACAHANKYTHTCTEHTHMRTTHTPQPHRQAAPQAPRSPRRRHPPAKQRRRPFPCLCQSGQTAWAAGG